MSKQEKLTLIKQWLEEGKTQKEILALAKENKFNVQDNTVLSYVKEVSPEKQSETPEPEESQNDTNSAKDTEEETTENVSKEGKPKKAENLKDIEVEDAEHITDIKEKVEPKLVVLKRRYAQLEGKFKAFKEECDKKCVELKEEVETDVIKALKKSIADLRAQILELKK